MNTSGFWWWSCRVVPRTSSWALAAHLRPTRASEWQRWFTQSFYCLCTVHVCTYLYYSLVFFEPVPLHPLPRLPLWVVVACVSVLRICGVVAPCCSSAVQHFDLHGEAAKRAVSATAEVHTGIVGRVTWAVCLFIWSSFRLRSSNCCFNRFKFDWLKKWPK